MDVITTPAHDVLIKGHGSFRVILLVHLILYGTLNFFAVDGWQSRVRDVHLNRCHLDSSWPRTLYRTLQKTQLHTNNVGLICKCTNVTGSVLQV